MIELLHRLEQGLAELDAQQLRRRRRTADTPCAPHVQVDGRAMLAFCSNDYLGLAAHPAIAEALIEGVRLYGSGSGGSHMISGHSRAHAQLEERLAAFAAPQLSGEQTRALYFCTGYMANVALMTALAASGDVDSDKISTPHSTTFFSEALNHASLIDGIRLARAQTGAHLHVYPHNDTAALATQLATSDATTKIIVTDSVFSMDGDIAPLPALLTLAEQHDAWLVVDDAHGFGVLGEQGRGALAHFGLASPHLIQMGTLGKAAGVGGAFVAAHRTVIEWLIQRARPYIYTTAAAPALAHALLTSLDLIAGPEGEHRRQHLQALIAQFRTELHLQRWTLLASHTAVQPVVLGANQAALDAAAALDAQGFWLTAIRPPTVPTHTARLRITLSAAHTQEDVRSLTQALNTLEATGQERP